RRVDVTGHLPGGTVEINRHPPATHRQTDPDRDIEATLTIIVHQIFKAVGAESPGSMPLSSSLEQEGRVIPPDYLLRGGELNQRLYRSLVEENRNPQESAGDFAAQ
ncbi:hypothetical protein QQ73_04420, partial [Candidatus Endoriftia persephone str. Guaymas]|nr:hypothetical protein [Candidatus Endoriftia persephone str. Guaymas]